MNAQKLLCRRKLIDHRRQYVVICNNRKTFAFIRISMLQNGHTINFLGQFLLLKKFDFKLVRNDWTTFILKYLFISNRRYLVVAIEINKWNYIWILTGWYGCCMEGIEIWSKCEQFGVCDFVLKWRRPVHISLRHFIWTVTRDEITLPNTI